MNKKTQISVILILIVLGFTARLFPHPANFVPIGAIAIFGALYLPRKIALLVPLLTMFVSDIFIGFYSWPMMASVYLGFALMGLIGLQVRKNKKFSTLLSGTLLGSFLFFLLTNTAVWAFGTMYTMDISGLFQSYYMALPFFRNSILGDLFYTGVLVGAVEALQYYYQIKNIKQKISNL
ncbi:MAG: hypothetical protein COX81_01400 [Candidatus Magasanikbacteria bacterium CG_4_10_14_0_2_um_filter_37_12]|uniref:ECF transporter S component n=1 Tax=Candidatus Magasanikbacteria bacterium CG_4_10_14_0_2_um_filter_37_12 TaxID=1974637 RepID=A0A2M7V8P4_9BACT|nr:MAG: hypothetical protein COX81_01400 [Candidatus Magasanikbacteria bacterium CG_4_10_14_0_2_um_filter_37_12]